jgi:hypothetical protein
MRRACAALIGLGLGLGGCHHHGSALSSTAALTPPKGAPSKTTENGPVKATVTLWPAQPHLGDPIYLRLEITAPAGIQVDAPFQEAGDQRMGRFTVTGFTREQTRTKDGGQQQDQTYTLEAPSSGKQRVPPLRITMLDTRAAAGSAAGKRQELLTDELPVDVLPVEQAQVDAKLHDALGPLDPDVGGTPWIWIVGIASALAVLGSGSLLALRAWQARRRLAKRKSAYEEAVAKLRVLEQRGAPTEDLADGWFVELSAIVRGYLERRYEIRAPELTTEEFLQVATRSPELTPDHRSLLTSFLERCDRVKFAGYRPDSGESIATLAAARGFVEDTRLREGTDLPDAARPKEAA